MSVLFGTNPAQSQAASQMLALIIPFGVFASFTFVFTSIFHACSFSALAFKILVASAAAKCFSSFVLCSIPTINIKAFPVSNGIFYCCIFILSVIFIGKTGVKFSFFKVFAAPVSASAVCAAAVKTAFDTYFFSLPVILRLFFTGTVFFLLYILVMTLFGFSVDISAKK